MEFVKLYYYKENKRTECRAWLDDGVLKIMIDDKFYILDGMMTVNNAKMHVEFLFKKYLDKKYDIIIEKKAASDEIYINFVHEDGLAKSMDKQLTEIANPNINWNDMIEISPFDNELYKMVKDLHNKLIKPMQEWSDHFKPAKIIGCQNSNF